MRTMAMIVVCTIFACTQAISAESPMDTEIDFLLATVRDSDCVFIRNGKEYDAEAATSHLEMKRERGRKYYDTTEQFIERIASKSSWSGKPYRIRCGDAEVDASTWFTDVLEQYRAQGL
jgi:hypothetical protein